MSQPSRQLADIALSGQENQHVAATAKTTGIDVLHQGRDLAADAVLGVRIRRVDIVSLDGKSAARHLDNGGVVEVAGKAVDVNGCGGNYHLEVRPLRQQALEVTQQEIDVQAAFVSLVDDDGVVGFKQPVALDFREQNTIGHELDRAGGGYLVSKAHLVADQAAKHGIEFLCDALRNRTGGQPAGLGMAYQFVAAAPQRKTNLR